MGSRPPSLAGRAILALLLMVGFYLLALGIALLLLSPLALGGWLWLRSSSLVSVDHVRVSGVRGPQARAIERALETAGRHMTTLRVNRAALLAAPLNPSRPAKEVGFDFRVARSFGYGASPEMSRRCLERLDEAGIPGRVELLRALSDTQPVATQGPVWYVGGKVL